MIKEHYPQYADFKFNCAPGSTGDGIELGQKAGGAIECMGRDLGAFLSTTNQAGSNFEIAFLYQTTPGILVNASGKQFGNIMSDNHGVLGRALLDETNGGKFFYVTDEAAASPRTRTSCTPWIPTNASSTAATWCTTIPWRLLPRSWG